MPDCLEMAASSCELCSSSWEDTGAAVRGGVGLKWPQQRKVGSLNTDVFCDCLSRQLDEVTLMRWNDMSVERPCMVLMGSFKGIYRTNLRCGEGMGREVAWEHRWSR